MLKCPDECLTVGEDQGVKFCGYCGKELVKVTAPLQTTLYLHSESESNRSQGLELGLTGDVLVEFSRAGYEVGLVVDIDPDTGEATMIGIQDRGGVALLERKVKI